MYAGHNVKSLAVPQICVSSLFFLSLGTEKHAATLTNNKLMHYTLKKIIIGLQIKWLKASTGKVTVQSVINFLCVSGDYLLLCTPSL